MMNRIRNELMADDGEQLAGDVEVDETSWGGRPRAKLTPTQAAAFRERKATVLGMVERGGKVKVRVIPSRRRACALVEKLVANINPGSILFTDDWQAYKPLRGRFLDHRIINHSAGVYVEGDTYTNTIEGFFGNFKVGARGCYRKILSEVAPVIPR